MYRPVVYICLLLLPPDLLSLLDLMLRVYRLSTTQLLKPQPDTLGKQDSEVRNRVRLPAQKVAQGALQPIRTRLPFGYLWRICGAAM